MKKYVMLGVVCWVSLASAYPLLNDESDEQPVVNVEEKHLLRAEPPAPPVAHPVGHGVLNVEDQLTALRRDLMKLQTKDLEPRFDQLSDDVAQLSLQVKRQNEQLKTMRAQFVRTMKHALDQPSPVAKPELAVTEKAEVKKAVAPSDPFRQGMLALADKDHQAATQAFKAFLSQHPKDPKAAQAYYWLGEMAMRQGRYSLSEAYWLSVVRLFPQDAKAADALLKLADVATKQQQTDRAREYLQRCVQDYPNSTAARLASARLRAQGAL